MANINEKIAQQVKDNIYTYIFFSHKVEVSVKKKKDILHETCKLRY